MLVDIGPAIALLSVPSGAFAIATRKNRGKTLCAIAFVFGIVLIVTAIFYSSIGSADEIEGSVLGIDIALSAVGILVSRA